MASEKYQVDEEPDVKKEIVAGQRKGGYVITPLQWGTFVTALIFLWFFLSVFYYMLLEIAVAVRGSDFKVLPQEYTGYDFNRNCASRDRDDQPCQKYLFNPAVEQFPWVTYACNAEAQAINDDMLAPTTYGYLSGVCNELTMSQSALYDNYYEF